MSTAMLAVVVHVDGVYGTTNVQPATGKLWWLQEVRYRIVFTDVGAPDPTWKLTHYRSDVTQEVDLVNETGNGLTAKVLTDEVWMVAWPTFYFRIVSTQGNASNHIRYEILFRGTETDE